MRCLYREKQIYHGDFLDVDIYPVFVNSKPRGSRKRKAKPTSETQQRVNDRNSKKNSIHLVNENFSANDFVIHLTYDNENLPENEEQAISDGKNFIRRLRRVMSKKGIELKYFCVYEQSPSGRHHFHIIITGGLEYKELASLWKYGIVEISPLRFDKFGVANLTKYITKQTNGKKKISHSRNLRTPRKKERDGKISARKVKEIHDYSVDTQQLARNLYPGYELADVEPFYNDYNGYFYLSLRLYKPEAIASKSRRGNF